MKRWEVSIWPADSAVPTRIEVEAEDQWRAILEAGRTGRVPLDVRELAVRPALATEVPGAWQVWP